MRKSISILIQALFLTCLFSPTPAAEKKPAWQVEWEKTVQAAEKEGQVVLYASSVYEEVFREFSKRYPKIKVIHYSGLSLDIVHRLMTERRANKYLADLTIMGGLTTYNYLFKARALDPIKPVLILPEVVDESKWFKEKHLYLDEERRYIFTFNEAASPFVGYNTKQVDPREIRSYWDLLQPRWKGKIVALDPMGSAVNAHLLFIYHNPKLGPKYLTRLLGEMDLVASRDRRQISDWVATGKFALSFLTNPSRADLNVAKAQGLPVNWFGPKDIAEGVSTSIVNGSVSLVNRAPHPNAAKVAMNWLLSREAQIAYQRLQFGSDSLRIDIPKDNVDPHAQRIEGAYYMELDNPEWRNPEPIQKILDEVWKKKH